MAKNEIRTRLTADGTGFKSVLNATQNQAKVWSNQIKGAIAGAFSIGAITNFARQIKSIADNVLTLRDTLGLTSDEIQRMDLALNRTGKATLENFKTGFQNFARNITAAIGDPNGKQSKLFSFLGLDPEQLRNGNAVDSFITTLERISDIQNDLVRTSTSTDLVGPDSGLKLAAAAADDLRGKLEDLRNSPAIIEQHDLENIKEASSKLDEISRTLQGGAVNAIIGPNRMGAEGIEKLKSAGSQFMGGNIARSAEHVGSALHNFASGLLFPAGEAYKTLASVIGFKGVKNPVQSSIDAQRKGMINSGNNRSGINPYVEMIKNGVWVGQGAQRVGGEPIFGAPDLGKDEAIKKAARSTGSSFTRPSDSLAKIGGFVGASNRAITIQQNVLREIKGTNKRLDRGVRLEDGL